MSSSDSKTRPIRVAFLHPDLGIGGAERLVVDAALGLQQLGHRVTMFTNHHDRNHCFEETRDGTLTVQVYGSALPRSFLKRFLVFFAILRFLYLSTIFIVKHSSQYDIIVVDQISHGIPILRLSPCKILFYCHFPDLLLSRRTSLVKRLYRWPVDVAEELTTGMSDAILVNSKYTQNMFLQTFQRLAKLHIQPSILYPSINFTKFDKVPSQPQQMNAQQREEIEAICQLDDKYHVFLSINRFERKKNIQLALQAFVLLKQQLSPQQFSHCKIIIAGGYDNINRENIEYYVELQDICKDANLAYCDYPSTDSPVIFFRNFSDVQKKALLHRALAVIYTPENEHFGIVPIEAMYARVPVLACNSGGPLESIEQDVTGWLCPPQASQFATHMKQLVEDEENSRGKAKSHASSTRLAARMGEAGKARVLSQFGLDNFSNRLNDFILDLMHARESCPAPSSPSRTWTWIAVVTAIILMLWSAIIAALNKKQEKNI